MHKCKYCFYSHIPHFPDYYCFAYSKSIRPDGKFWAHFPACKKENCPLKHPELLEGAILINRGDFINCQNCIYWEDYENKESRDGCYFGEPIDEI